MVHRRIDKDEKLMSMLDNKNRVFLKHWKLDKSCSSSFEVDMDENSLS